MRVDVPIPGKDEDYNSRKSRAVLVNLMVENNQNGTFRAIKKREGVTLFGTLNGNDQASTNFLRDASNPIGGLFIGGRNNLHQIDVFGAINDLGSYISMGLNIPGELRQNNQPTPQLFINETYTISANVYSGGVFTQITDVDFTNRNPGGMSYLGGRFWFADQFTDEFFCSDANAVNFNPLAVGAANVTSGTVIATQNLQSALWVFTQNNTEYWQLDESNSTFPLRRVQGASLNVGMFQKLGVTLPVPLTRIKDYVAFVADDLTVRILQGAQQKVVSDLDYALPISGDGTPVNDGIKTINPFVSNIDAIEHKYIVVSSREVPNSADTDVAEFTWVYDLSTNYHHYRTSPGENFWNYWESGILQKQFGPLVDGEDQIILMNGNAYQAGGTGNDGFQDPNIYQLDPNVYRDLGVDFDCILQTGSLSFDQDVTIDYIEVEMETGVGNADSANPVMSVEYSKDGGSNFITWGTVPLGGSTDPSNRVRMNNFGRLVRHRDFILRLTITEPVRVQFYGIYAEVNGGF